MTAPVLKWLSVRAWFLALAFFLGVDCAVISGTAAETHKPNQILIGKVVGVHDGDTITVLTASNQQVKVRLAEIDAPEMGQAFGKRSKQALSEKVFGKEVRVEVVDQDRHGRTVGEIRLGDRWINKEMVAEGWAWKFTQYSKSTELGEAEQRARAKKLGLWQDKEPIPPWEFRHPTHLPQDQEEHPMPLIKIEW